MWVTAILRCCELEFESESYVSYVGEWKRMPGFDKLLIFKALRPDRLTIAVRDFVAGTLGHEYTTARGFNLEQACQVMRKSHSSVPGNFCSHAW